MAKSYLILDEYMRFLDRDRRKLSLSILDSGVHEALGQVYWDTAAVVKRGGIYDWDRYENTAGYGKSHDPKLLW
jgi:radical S-adenosyl methionine domain-containing protein 2